MPTFVTSSRLAVVSESCDREGVEGRGLTIFPTVISWPSTKTWVSHCRMGR